MLHTSRKCCCRDVSKISLWTGEHICNQNTTNFDRILNSIEIPLVGLAPCMQKYHQIHGKTSLFVKRGSVIDIKHDDVIKWRPFPRNWSFLRGILRSPVNYPHKGQWRGALIFSLICTRIKGSVNNCEAGDWRRHRAHYDVTVIWEHLPQLCSSGW